MEGVLAEGGGLAVSIRHRFGASPARANPLPSNLANTAWMEHSTRLMFTWIGGSPFTARTRLAKALAVMGAFVSRRIAIAVLDHRLRPAR